MADPAIPYYEPGERISGINGSASPIVSKTFVDVNGNKNTGDPRTINVKTCAAAAKAIGVAGQDIAVGERGVLLTSPGMVVPVTAGGTLTAGQEVEVGANGQAVTLAAGKAVGKALDGATAGNDAMIKLY
jgi:hypothetical protein